MGENIDKNTYTQKEIENIITNSFNCGMCYGMAKIILQDNYDEGIIINASRELMESAMPSFRHANQ